MQLSAQIMLMPLAALVLVLSGCDSTSDSTGRPLEQDVTTDDIGSYAPDMTGYNEPSSEESTGSDEAVVDAGLDTTSLSDVMVQPDSVNSDVCAPTMTLQTVTFVHVNDLHSSYIPSQDGNPYARLVGYVKEVRAENPYTLFTDGGDDHEKGCFAEQTTKGLSTMTLTRAMEFDVRVLGNHDFAWSIDEVLQHSRDPKGIVLASNISYIGDDPEGFGAVSYAEKQIGCVRVGFFGLVSGPWDDQDTPYQGDFYAEMPTRFDYVHVANEIMAQHRANVDLMVLVSHLGNDLDKALASVVPGIDVILGGHSHTVLAEPEVVGDTLIVQSGSGGNFVTRLDVTIDLAQRRIAGWQHDLKVNVLGSLPADAEMEALLSSFLDAKMPAMQKPVAIEKESLGDARVAVLAARAAVSALGADAGLVDPGTVWTSISAGRVVSQDLMNSFLVEREPAGTSGFSSFVLANISGADLAAIRDGMLEWGFAARAQPDPAKTYTLAIQKRTASRPDLHLPPGVTLSNIRQSDEVWMVLVKYAVLRNYNCMYLDVDEYLPGCN